jgi:mannosyltransferase OCH1-like enzyme
LIPRVLHQTWKDADVPERWRPLQRTWREHHPDWDHRFWTDADLRDLVAEHYPWFLEAYDAYDHAISRVDAARYFLLHRHGGVYVDLDFESLRSLDGLLVGHSLVLGVEPESHTALSIVRTRPRALTRVVCNAFIASTPGHSFWTHVFPRLVAHARERDPLDTAGPFFLTDAIDSYYGDVPAHVASAAQLYPLDKAVFERGGDALADHRARIGAEAYAVHHWAGSWIEGYRAEDRRLRDERGWGPPRFSARRDRRF